MEMSIEEFLKIFESDETCWEGDNAFQGLQIIAKYSDNVIHAAEHDIIYSENISVLVEKGITKHEVETLRNLNWMVQDESYLACFV